MLRALLKLRTDLALTLAATLTLAACIAANTTIFSVANAILVRPLPYPQSGRIQWISERSGPNRDDIAAAPDYFAIREQGQIFDDVAAVSAVTVNLTGVERPAQLDASRVTASFFRVMGAPPFQGRYFAADEEGPKAPAVAVVSYAFWRNELGGNPNVLGTSIALDRLPHTIIGVMPQGFDFPQGSQVWLPSALSRASNGFPISPTSPIFAISIVARLKSGIAPQQATAEMSRLTANIRAEYLPFQATGFRSDLVMGAEPLQQHLTGDARPPLLLLSCAAGLVMLIACVNLANLLLARAGNRQRELAIRMALGSSRGRMVRQMLTESLVLALPGGIAGIALAALAIDALNAMQPAVLVRFPPIAMDLRVLVFSVVLTIATSLLFGIAPALAAARINILEALKSSGIGYSGGPASTRLRKTLLVSQLAVSLMLLIGSGLLFRSFLNLAHTELGFPADHLLTFRVDPIGGLDRNYTAFYNNVLARLQSQPSMRSAALLTDMPLNQDDFYNRGRVQVVGHPAIPFRERPRVNNTLVSQDFFRTLGIPLKQGRGFDDYDGIHTGAALEHGFVSTEPVVVNEAFVEQLLPNENPLNRTVTFGPDERKVTWTIVGVAGNVRGSTLGAALPAMVYRCTCAGSTVSRAGFMIRTQGDPKAAIAAAESAVRAVDRDQPVFDVKTMEERREAVLAPESFQLMMIGAFAGIAVLLAVAGVYGVMSYLVARRTREIAIRMALGARQGEVMRMVLAEASTLVVASVAMGLAGSLALTRVIRTLLYGVKELDPITFALTPVLLAGIVLLASFGPARRAVGIDPLTALREE